MRRLGQLCDVVLVTGPVERPAHRVVLAAVSPYFRVLFSDNGMRESGQVRCTRQAQRQETSLSVTWRWWCPQK